MFLSFDSLSQSISLVKKDEWGSSSYTSVIKINDHIYAVTNTGTLDIIDPTKALAEQLVGQVNLSSDLYADELDNYNGFLSVTVGEKVVLYELSNPILPTLVFEFQVDNEYNSGQRITEGENHYVIEKDRLYVVNYNEESGFNILAAHTFEDLVYENVYGYQAKIEQGILFIHQVEVPDPLNFDEKKYVIREYNISDLNDVKLVSKVSISTDSISPKTTYIGQRHFALSTQNSVQIFKTENNTITMISEIEVGVYSLGLYWQEDLKRLRVITPYTRYSYILSSFANPTLESIESTIDENRVSQIYQFLSDNDAIVQTQTPRTIALIDLTDQDSLTPLYDQSGNLVSMAISDETIYALKHSNVQVINIQGDKLTYNNKLHIEDSIHLSRSVAVKGQNVFIDSNQQIRVYESSETALPEFKFNVDVPTTDYITDSITDGNNRILNEHNTPTIHWYDIEASYSILIPPLSLDISTYVMGDDISLSYISKLYFVNGHLAVLGSTNDGKSCMLIIKNNGQELKVTDYLSIDSSYGARFFVGNTHLFKIIRYDNKLTEYQVSNEGKLTELRTSSLSLTGDNEEVYTGLVWDDYLITQTYSHLQLYKYSTLELKPIVKVEMLPTASNPIKMLIADGKLVVGNQFKGTLSLFGFNLAPTFNITAVEVNEDSQIVISDIASDNENDKIEYSIIELSSNGELILSDDKLSISYLPNSNYFGNDQFSLRATDIHGNYVEQSFTVQVKAVDDTPTTSDSSESIDFDSMYTGILIATDVDGDTLTFSVVNDVQNGVLELASDGSYTYQPNTSFSGTDSFDYQVTDLGGNSAQATITINVQEKPPVIVETKPQENNSSSGGGSYYWLVTMLLTILGYRQSKLYNSLNSYFK